MKNKTLSKLIALIVFVNFTIPSYVIDAAAQGSRQPFSRNIAPRELLKEADEEPQRIPDSFFEEKSKESKDPLREDGTFTDIGSTAFPVPGVVNSSFAWGDFDNDGYLDILITGHKHGKPISKIYRNNGNGTFTNIGPDAFPAFEVSNGSVAWGDFNNNGYLDVLITGSTCGNCPPVWPPYISRIYRNNGNGTFTDIGPEDFPAPGVWLSSVAWGDFNNNGYLDVLITGSSTTGRISKIYRNNGDGTFTDIGSDAFPAPGVRAGSVAWGDFDNDGYLDILITGETDDGTSISKIYRNNGDGTFTDIGSDAFPAPGVYISSIALGDFDNDGYLDVLIMGETNNSTRISKIYRNNGNGTFTDIGPDAFPAPGACLGSVAWGDFDNDGYLDVLIAGAGNSATGPISKIYRNNGNGTFTDVGPDAFPAPGVNNSSVAWGDFDNDGYLDILITGEASGARISRIYRNLGANFGITQNTTPSAPTGLQSSFQGDKVTLSWQKATDAQTPQDGLSYNIYIGTQENGVDIVSPMSEVPNGWRKVAAIGSQNQNTYWTINDLPDGVYYWGVQAIDTAFAGSEFATETFTINTSLTISGTVTLNGSGLGNVAIKKGSTTLATTVANGTYSFSKPHGWTGTVTPSKTGYTFSPPNRTYTNLSSNRVNQNYTATLNTYTISGRITMTSTTIPVIPLPEREANPISTNAFSSDHRWSFAQANDQIEIIDGGSTIVGVAHVDIVCGNGNVLATTNSKGYYSFSKSHGWSGTVTPSRPGYTFSPASRTYTNLNSNRVNQNYTATPSTYTISGIVTIEHIGGMEGVELKSNGILITTTGTGGSYSFTRPYGWSGAITLHKPGYGNWDPPIRIYVNLSQNFFAQNYIGTVAGADDEIDFGP